MEKTIDSARIAQNIKNLRQSKQLTQIEMADLLGYSERQVRRLETEGTMNIYVINLIAQTFKISAVCQLRRFCGAIGMDLFEFPGFKKCVLTGSVSPAV